ncbi:ACT domain-containing protein [Shewanella psychromarinicola]|uniref:ACT domain-containing protein n=1 Tax=Shewanella psychromarinicola TaxID=2487742 RepID=A0A3N4EJT8_9GAMM|nr:ACT domain-containing protein [Shewanella psychromarinicola]AZG36649.1 ACT domain-containing protein [Shewanella psychromarinicola]MCL1082342.1 ACT domain-containing protein [Shewanella psychromarinicola]RPA34500.1 ACT domain-containing protein [Shewanella psychromarinicola]
MVGETNLTALLASISPVLLDDEYVFCSVQGQYGDYQTLSPLATFRESEGLTLVLTKAAAIEGGLSFESVFKGITLTVHSSLDAVGLTAAVANKLTEKGISANVIAAYYHDHIFVQTEKAALAIEALNELSKV